MSREVKAPASRWYYVYATVSRNASRVVVEPADVPVTDSMLRYRGMFRFEGARLRVVLPPVVWPFRKEKGPT